jgi:hypothetical protein
MIRKNVWIPFLAVFLAVTAAPAEEYRNFSDPSLGLSFQYPATWSLSRSSEGGKNTIRVEAPISRSGYLAGSSCRIDVYPGVRRNPNEIDGTRMWDGRSAYDYWVWFNQQLNIEPGLTPVVMDTGRFSFAQQSIDPPENGFAQQARWDIHWSGNLADVPDLAHVYMLFSLYGYSQSATYTITCGYFLGDVDWNHPENDPIVRIGNSIRVSPIANTAIAVQAPPAGAASSGAGTISKTSKETLEYPKYNRPWGWFQTHTYDLGSPVALKTVSGKVYAGPSERKNVKYSWQIRISDDNRNWTTVATIGATGAKEEAFGPVTVNRTARYVQIFTGGNGYVDDSGLTITK